MPQFPDEWLEKVKDSVDIVEYVGRRVNLKRSGKNFIGICPFHEEKTPSFVVNPEKRFYYCFGCGNGGDIFNFVMQTEDLSFGEAAAKLGEAAGMPRPSLTEAEKQRVELQDRLYHINRLAARFFYQALRKPEARAAREYLVKRGIDQKLARSFLLGFAPAEWDALLSFLTKEGISPGEAERAGLALKGKQGYYDRFRGRVIFPICDFRGRFAGFGGRALGNERPKYLNSPETPVFRKSEVLYGLNWAREAIKDQGNVVIVEGYTDCIGLSAQGINNVVASLGTAFTEEHARLLSRFTSEVVVAFDGDEAGVKATQRGLDLLVSCGLQVKVAALPPGEDPDSFARRSTTEEVRSWLQGALPYVEYRLRSVVAEHHTETREGKLKALQEIVPILADIKSEVERSEYTRLAAQLLATGFEELRLDVERAINGAASSVHSQVSVKPSHNTTKNRHTIRDFPRNSGEPYYVQLKGNRSDFVEKSILHRILRDSQLIEDLTKSGVTPGFFHNDDYRHLFKLLEAGTWDRHGQAVAEDILSEKEPLGLWEEYVKQLKQLYWSRVLSNIEEKLVALENNMENPEIHYLIWQIIRDYFKIRKEITAR